MKDISKLYDQLMSHERTMAILKAMARDDRDEVDRLVRTCPHKTYKGADPAYADRMHATRLITAGCYTDLNRVIGQLRMLDALKEHLLSQKGLQRWLHDMVFEDGIPVGRWSSEERKADIADADTEVVNDADFDLDAAIEAECKQMDVIRVHNTDLRNQIAKQFKLEVEGPDLMGQLEPQSFRFLAGGWLETFVWKVVDDNKAAMGLWDVQLGASDLCAGDVQAAQFLHDLGDFACADAMDVHLGDGEGQGAFAADAALEGGGIERSAMLVGVIACLGDLQWHVADTGGQGLGLVSVGVAAAGVGALMKGGVEDLLAFASHGVVEQRGECVADGVGAVLDEQFHELVERVRVCLGVPGVGHSPAP